MWSIYNRFFMDDFSFRNADLILTVAWVALAVSGTLFQYLRERKRPPFSPPAEMWRRRNGHTPPTLATPTEQTPLLADDARSPWNLTRVFVFGFISSRFLFVSSFRVASLFFIRGFKPRLVSLRQILTHVPHNVSIFFKPKSLKKRIISMNPRVFVLLFVSLCFVFFCCGFFLSWMFSNPAIFFRNTRHVRLW